MAFDTMCCDCTYCDTNPNKDGKFKCTNRRSGYDFVSANMYKCDVYCGTNRGFYQIREMRDISKKHGYYIVTIVSEILGLPMDNRYMVAFEYFKNYGLQRIDDNNKFIEEYDELGPIIAEKISNEENAIEYAKYIRETYLEIFATLIENDKIEEAYDFYSKFFESLKQKYNVQRDVKKLELN